MENGYEMAQVAELGKAAEMILGMKFLAVSCDTLLGFDFYMFSVEDIDEGDE